MLVPRSVYAQRAAFYSELAGGDDKLPKSWLLSMPPAERTRAAEAAARQASKFTVRPLVFKWSSLSIAQLLKLMRVRQCGDEQFEALLQNKLREYRQNDGVPAFHQFCQEMTDAW